MIDDTMRLFLHSVDRDIEHLEKIEAPEHILEMLRGMQDNVRSKWAVIISNDRKDIINEVHKYLELNAEVNRVYNSIVIDRSDYHLKNKTVDLEPIDEYILTELFLSYTIFLDAYNELGFYYVICNNFPLDNSLYFVQQRAMREAARRVEENDE